MTIIIASNRFLWSDTVSATNNRSVHNRKLYARKNVVWGGAGYTPSPHMLAAESLAELGAAVLLQAYLRRADEILAYCRISNKLYHGSLTWDKADAVATFDWTETLESTGIGSYSNEWNDSAERRRALDGADAAGRFCESVGILYARPECSAECVSFDATNDAEVRVWA